MKCHEAVDNATLKREIRLKSEIHCHLVPTAPNWNMLTVLTAVPMELFSLANLPVSVVLLLAALLGASIGSFLTLVTYRLPRDEPIGLSRSRCPTCRQNLQPRDLVPVLSWACSRGRCRHCQTRVNIRYPLTELATAAGTASAILHLGPTWQGLALSGLWWCIIAIIVTDLEHTIILDEVQIAVALFGTVYGLANGTPWENMVEGAVCGAAIGLTLKYGFLYLRNKDGLGMGDVKFLAAAGLWIASGFDFIPFSFFLRYFWYSFRGNLAVGRIG